MLIRVAIIALFCAALVLNTARGGGSGLNVIVVVNQNSTNSVQLGNDYCEKRGVPPQNLLRMTTWTGGNMEWAPGDFKTNLLNPLLGMVATRGLTNQAQFVVLSMDIPYRVTDGSNYDSTTSALFYGFKTNDLSGLATCSLPDNTSNSYACSEMPFSLAPPNTATTNSFLAMMLTDTNLAEAESVLAQGVAADYSYPTQAVYLLKTSDVLRNVRYVEFDNSVFENQVLGNYAMTRISADGTGYQNLFGMQTGLGNYSFANPAFVPGALADTLSSYTGALFDTLNGGQTPITTFLEAGATASYGTVVEPCNYTQKFPDPVDYFYQTRGFSVAEAYYQSVLNPFEGVFVGEPLAAPFARPGSANWSSLTNRTVLSGLVTLSPNFTAATTNLPLARADLFVDGTFFQTMTNLPPNASNVLSVVLNGHRINYTVPTNASLASVASGLAGAMNFQSGVTHVGASAAGDRVEVQSLQVYVPGSNVTASASSVAISTPVLNTYVTAVRPTFLDTVATGYQVVTLYNMPITNDWIQIMFMKTNGTVVRLGVTNTVSGTTIGTMAFNLLGLINSNATLQAADGVNAQDYFDYDPYAQAAAQFNVYANQPGWPASQILTTITTSTNLQATPVGSNPLADNVNDLRPKNHLYIRSGTNLLAVSFVFDTTRVSDGYHQLTAMAYEGSSVATQTRITRNVLVQNSSLTATLASLPAGTNATLAQQLQFTVTPNATNISRIELFGNGGSLAVAANQATAIFSLAASYLGQGLLPFYAVVTDQSGHRFQTASVWYRVVPAFSLSLVRSPASLSWTAVTNYQYEVQSTTNLATAFQTVATVVATNAVMQWPISLTNRAAFYRVQMDQ